MIFAYTILYVQDVAQTVVFYNEAFGFATKFITPEKDYAELVSGSTTLAFASHALGQSNFKKGFIPSKTSELPFGIELAFTTKDIATDFQKAVDAGAIVYEAVVQKPWGQSVGYLRDINGFLIEVCTPVKS